MKRRCAATLMELVVPLAIWLILAAILIPVFSRARNNARRANCMSNQKQIIFALWHYVEDNNGALPQRNWVSPIKPYAKESAIFRCPSKSASIGASDYFFNSRFLNKQLEDIQKPQTLILLGDGNDDSPLKQMPASWLKDEISPAWRHLEGANYGFVDGHIKWLKPARLTSDFRLVQP